MTDPPAAIAAACGHQQLQHRLQLRRRLDECGEAISMPSVYSVWDIANGIIAKRAAACKQIRRRWLEAVKSFSCPPVYSVWEITNVNYTFESSETCSGMEANLPPVTGGL
jgi:hypothetical protein